MRENGYAEDAIPDGATQIFVVAREHPEVREFPKRFVDIRVRRETALLQFVDVDHARTWLEPRARTWDWIEPQGHVGPQLALLGAHGEWAKWDDGSVVFGDLMGASEYGGAIDRVGGTGFPHVPRANEAVGQAVAILARTLDYRALGPRVEPYMAAVRVDRIVEAEAHPPDAERSTSWHRHTFYAADGVALGDLWTITVVWAGDDPGESVMYSDDREQAWRWYDQHAPDEQEALRAATDPRCAGRYVDHCDECGTRHPVGSFANASWIGANLGQACSDRCADAMSERAGRHAVRYHNWTVPAPSA
jgi:hypothetical protein